MPKALVIDDESPRRRAASRADAQEVAPERGFIVRMLLRHPKDVAAGAVAAIAAIAIVGNATFMQAGRHPAPMFSAVFPDTPAPSAAMPNVSSNGPLPRPRPTEADAHADFKAAEAPAAPAVKAVPAPAAQPSAAPRPPAPIQAHADPVGDLIASTSSTRRIASVQRVLTEFGYGQLKPTGTVGPDTRAAIEHFERDRKLPVTGQITDRVVRELSAATGRSFD